MCHLHSNCALKTGSVCFINNHKNKSDCFFCHQIHVKSRPTEIKTTTKIQFHGFIDLCVCVLMWTGFKIAKRVLLNSTRKTTSNTKKRRELEKKIECSVAMDEHALFSSSLLSFISKHALRTIVTIYREIYEKKMYSDCRQLALTCAWIGKLIVIILLNSIRLLLCLQCFLICFVPYFLLFLSHISHSLSLFLYSTWREYIERKKLREPKRIRIWFQMNENWSAWVEQTKD